MTDKKKPDPSPPPKGSEEDRRFKNLLRQLIAVPANEIREKRQEHRKARKKRSGGV